MTISIRIFNYVLAVLSFLIFLCTAATFFPSVKSFTLKRWLGGERFEGVLSDGYLPDSSSETIRLAGVVFDVVSLGNRRLFMKFPSQEEPVVKKIARDDNEMRDLKLVAIIRDGSVKAAIENKKTASTSMLELDDYCGDMKVVEIGDNKVVLEKEDRLYSLFM